MWKSELLVLCSTNCLPVTFSGVHLSVDEFHQAADRYLQSEEERQRAVFVDCRNFYESDIVSDFRCGNPLSRVLAVVLSKDVISIFLFLDPTALQLK